MGIFGELFQFDMRRYHDVVVPAFQAGEDHPVIASALRAMADAGMHYQLPGCGLTEALDYALDVRTDCEGNVRQRLLRPVSELIREDWDYESISLLYEWIVMRETVDAYACVSSRHPTRVFDPLSPRAQELIELLSTPPDDETWLPGIDGVEITGWLDAAQTAELLSLLPPPDEEQDDEQGQVHRLRQQQALLLLKRAVDHEHGVLWGTEMTITIKKNAMFTDRTPPIAYGPFPRPDFPQFFDPVTWKPIPPRE